MRRVYPHIIAAFLLLAEGAAHFISSAAQAQATSDNERNIRFSPFHDPGPVSGGFRSWLYCADQLPCFLGSRRKITAYFVDENGLVLFDTDGARSAKTRMHSSNESDFSFEADAMPKQAMFASLMTGYMTGRQS